MLFRSVFAMLFLGVVLKRVGWINDNFIHTASALVFNVTMPALLSLGILHADLRAALQRRRLGEQLLDRVREETRARGYRFLVLDTGMHMALAQRFYFRQGLLPLGMHFSQDVSQ